VAAALLASGARDRAHEFSTDHRSVTDIAAHILATARWLPSTESA
jgi:hypothetical protein